MQRTQLYGSISLFCDCISKTRNIQVDFYCHRSANNSFPKCYPNCNACHYCKDKAGALRPDAFMGIYYNNICSRFRNVSFMDKTIGTSRSVRFLMIGITIISTIPLLIVSGKEIAGTYLLSHFPEVKSYSYLAIINGIAFMQKIILFVAYALILWHITYDQRLSYYFIITSVALLCLFSIVYVFYNKIQVIGHMITRPYILFLFLGGYYLRKKRMLSDKI